MRRSNSTNIDFRNSRRTSVTTIEDWELAELLGVGGFGRVYRAVGKRGSGEWAGKEVAIKMIEKSRTKTIPSLHDRIRKEVSIHWRLSHSSILSLYDYFEDSQYVYLVMEYCAGGELYRYLQKRASLCGQSSSEISEPEARWVMKQLVEGLKYLHGLDILHRDLKLSNVLLTKDREIKLADFGLATKVSGYGGEQNTMCGTPNYISPEIISRQPYGLASDVWSLGCMLVTFLTGKPPFENKEVRVTLQNVTKAKYTLPNSVSREGRDLIHSLLQVNPTDRPVLSEILDHPWFNTRSQVMPLRDLTKFEETGRILPPRKGPSRSGLVKENGESAVDAESVGHTWKRQSFEKENIPPSHFATSQFGKSTRSKFEQKTFTSSLSSFDDNTLHRLNTKHLKPIKQRTKHGTIEIIKDGRVIVDFSDATELFVVSDDGEKVDLYEKSMGTSLSNPLGIWKRAYRFTDLPKELVKKYRYATRFVQLLRSKTPKIIFCSPQAKCILMENHPFADFEMHFHNGIKVHNSIDRQELTIKVPVSISSPTDFEIHRISTANTTNVSVPSRFINVFKHAQECLRQCLEIERRVESERLGGEGKWPVVLKSSQCRENTRLDTSMRMEGVEGFLEVQPGLSGEERRRAEQTDFAWVDQRTFVGVWGKQLNQPMSVVESLEDNNWQSRSQKVKLAPSGSFTDFKVVENARKGPNNLSRSSSTHLTMSTNTMSNARTFSTLPTSISSSSSHPHSPKPSLPQSPNLQFSHISEAGWCIKTPADGKFTICFWDGTRIVVEAKGQKVIYFGASDRVGEEFKIDRSLPPFVKSKLAYFPEFVKGFGIRAGSDR